MHITKAASKMDITTFFSALIEHSSFGDVNPVVMVREVPQIVPEEYLSGFLSEEIEEGVGDNAISLYHELRKDFAISHTEMAKWLGVKRRTMYNWMESPERSRRYGPQIEGRLMTLQAFRNEMEPEHFSILYKIAFSPIYGDPKFGGAILSGESHEKLVGWYDQLFSQFESYRSSRSGIQEFT